jgi:hypothetical protein
MGILKEVGFKFNRWLDANLMTLKLWKSCRLKVIGCVFKTKKQKTPT